MNWLPGENELEWGGKNEAREQWGRNNGIVINL